LEKIVKRYAQALPKLLPMTGVTTYKILFEDTDEVRDEKCIARVYNEVSLDYASIQIIGFRLLDMEFDSVEDAEIYILSILVHEATHRIFAQYFDIINLPEHQKDFLFEKISYITEYLTKKLCIVEI
jgi:hypothetical protein